MLPGVRPLYREVTTAERPREYRLTELPALPTTAPPINQRPIVDVGQRVEFQDVRADGPSTDRGGRSPWVGTSSWAFTVPGRL